MSILFLHGPHPNPFGTREPVGVGVTTLQEIDTDLARIAADSGALLHRLQRNQEGVVL